MFWGVPPSREFEGILGGPPCTHTQFLLKLRITYQLPKPGFQACLDDEEDLSHEGGKNPVGVINPFVLEVRFV